MAAKVCHLRVDFRIKPIGLEHRRLQVVDIEQERHPAKMTKPILQAAKETLGVLTHHRFAIAFARVAQHRPQHPAAARLCTLALLNGSSQPEINLHLFPRLAFDAPHSLRLPLLEPTHEALD
jgi:hypothetical protein